MRASRISRVRKLRWVVDEEQSGEKSKEKDLAKRKEAEKINIAFDNSSKKNRNLFIFFLGFMFYVVLIVPGTTDQMLLHPESKIILPILQIEIPFLMFYFFAPILMLIFHFNLLFNLAQHYKKLLEWKKYYPDKGGRLADPFLFNFQSLSEKQSSRTLLNLVLWFLIHLLPISCLTLLQWRFSDFHSSWMTIYHCSLMFVDLLFLQLPYWVKIHGYRQEEEQKRAWISHFSWTFIPILIGPVAASILNLYVLLNLNSFKAPENVKPWIIPILDLPEQTLIAAKPEAGIIVNYIDRGKNRNDAIREHSQGLILRERDLRRANFNQSKLFKADLRRTKLQGSNLIGSKLQDAILTQAVLQHANLASANLQGATLKNAALQKANLERVKLRNAFLLDAKLQGANFLAAELQDVNLRLAQLHGAIFRYAQLQGADLSMTKSQGVDLRNAQLQGADLSHAKLQGADLRGAQLQGANLSFAKLQGADLRNAQLQGTTLHHTQLQGANLNSAQLQGAILVETQVRGVNLLNTNLEGSNGRLRWEKKANWKRIQAYAQQIPETSRFRGAINKQDFLSRIQEAKERTETEKEESYYQELQKRIDSNQNQFHQIRVDLICKYKSIPLTILSTTYQEQLLQKHKEMIQAKQPPFLCENILEKIKTKP